MCVRVALETQLTATKQELLAEKDSEIQLLVEQLAGESLLLFVFGLFGSGKSVQIARMCVCVPVLVPVPVVCGCVSDCVCVCVLLCRYPCSRPPLYTYNQTYIDLLT